MKKHDEGYVLVYVTVVLLIFCLVATVILTGALRSLNAQQNAIAQMKDQYVAEGEIEKVLASLDNFIKSDGVQTVDCGDAVDATWDNDQKVLTLKAHSGSVLVTCELKLNVSSVTISETAMDSATQLTITDLKKYTITAFRTGTYEGEPAEPVPSESSSAENGGGNG